MRSAVACAVYCLVGLAVNVQAWADKHTVTVGGYAFPPFVEVHPGKSPRGLTLDMIEAMNAAQDDYQFQFVLLDANQRFNQFKARRFDMILFESMAWGWKGWPLDASKVYLTGGEVYLAKAEAGRDQSFFDDLASKRLVGIAGYHYQFSDFDSDAASLKQRFDIQLIDNHRGTIKMILSGRGDVAVVTKSYLDFFLKNTENHAGDFLVSDKLDQEYRHTILVRQGAVPPVSVLNALLGKMNASGVLPRLWEKYGIQN